MGDTTPENNDATTKVSLARIDQFGEKEALIDPPTLCTFVRSGRFHARLTQLLFESALALNRRNAK